MENLSNDWIVILQAPIISYFLQCFLRKSRRKGVLKCMPAVMQCTVDELNMLAFYTSTKFSSFTMFSLYWPFFSNLSLLMSAR